jgi:O-antigen/teichoic acid export membrane protein
MSLVCAMQGAFTPAITQAYGEGDYAKGRMLSYRSCKFGLLLVILFVIPLLIELPAVFNLWLKNPPEYSVGLCLFMLIILVIDKSALGHMIAIYATGKIAGYQFFSGGALILTVPVAWMFVELGFGVYSIGVALVISMMLCVFGRIWYARKYANLSFWYWLKCIVVRVFVVSVLIACAGLIPRLLMPESLVRICLTSLICLLTYLPLVWIVALNYEERRFVGPRIKRLINKLWKMK